MNGYFHQTQMLCMSCLMLCSVMLSACGKNTAPKAEKYATLEEATTALNSESAKIDLYIVELGQAKTEAEKKKIACDQIPQQYDAMLAIIDANQHLISVTEQKMQAQFKHMALAQKARFTDSLWCKSA